jgi:BirA family biotin operon repressor/biotin-[acetyl-CoA-carboxylase] ligase
MNEFRHIRLDRVSSTNEFASFWVSKTSPVEGTVISSVDQYAGRGQLGRYWHASPGQNITMSVILYPKNMISMHQFDLNMILSLGVTATLSAFLPDKKIQIKWPNDIYIDNKKIAGLLIQITSMGKQVKSAIFGVGLNLYENDFPTEIPNPVSLFQFQENLPSISELIHLIWENIMGYYDAYQVGSRDDITIEYQKQLYRYQELCLFSSREGEEFEGRIKGVNEIGKLVIHTTNGMRTFAMSEIKMKTDT